MKKLGKGITLAFFLTISFFTFADEQAEVSYPLIARLEWRDNDFKKYIADVEENRRKVFLRDRFRRGDLRESTQAIADSLTFFRYIPREADNIFSLAARCLIPYSALASLNRLSNEAMLEKNVLFLLPSAQGIFVPAEPVSDLEMLLASSRFPPDDEDTITLVIDGVLFYFFPGSEFNHTERAFFLNSGFRFPLRSYRLTSNYGMRRSPITGNMHFHQGIDLAAPEGTEVYAAGNGTVTAVGYDPVYGNYIIINHNNNWASLYGHLQKSLVSLRTNVRSGTLIGLVGSTGQSTGPHLHFELRQNGRAQDPDKYLFMPGGR